MLGLFKQGLNKWLFGQRYQQNQIDDNSFVMLEPTYDDLLVSKKDEVMNIMGLIDYMARYVAYESGSRAGNDSFQNIHNLHNYQVSKIKTDTSALIGEIHIPNDIDSNNTIEINWQGTCNLAQVMADLFEESPGSESYARNEIAIAKQIIDVVEAYATRNRPVQLSFTGHSLGAALAQQTFNTIQKLLADEKFKDSHAISLDPRHIQSINLGTCNAPGVTKAVEHSSNKLAKPVARLGVKQKAIFGMIGGDTIQTAGHGTVLSHANPEDVEIHLVKIDRGVEKLYRKGASVGAITGLLATAMCTINPLIAVPLFIAAGAGGATLASTAVAHTTTALQDNAQGIGIKIYSNWIPEENAKIRKSLKNKSRIINHATGVARFTKKLVDNTAHCIGAACDTARKFGQKPLLFSKPLPIDNPQSVPNATKPAIGLGR